MGISARTSPEEVPGEFTGHVAGSGLGFHLFLVENCSFYVIGFNFMLFCKLEKKILRSSKALKQIRSGFSEAETNCNCLGSDSTAYVKWCPVSLFLHMVFYVSLDRCLLWFTFCC